ncbi:TetR/AcrR family transcriptional regulator [Chromobacterium paludis]|uniref:TetR/AcrR family transcriptional regulator n=1 Tax=Chromobacterium paludis TaxID=2605945 RepID=A0A5C1DI46_9NEIS|nr:TetR/AcrR family transcriptional regulator [Chromobacterium paludis]QEL55639.1 TetR/AcrR family transcriptional regulator [Chromobacterium paludis]
MENKRRWQRKKEARPKEILEAAFRLFAAKGFHAVRMEDIAELAGMSSGTAYLYFGGKRDIFTSAVRLRLAGSFRWLDEVASSEALGARERLRGVVRQFNDATGSAEFAVLCRLLIAEACSFPELTRLFVEDVIQRMRAAIACILLDGIACGELAPTDAHATVDVLMAASLTGLLWQAPFASLWGGQSGARDAGRQWRGTLDALIEGLALPAPCHAA